MADAKLNDDQKREIAAKLKAGTSSGDLAKEYGVAPATIRRSAAKFGS